ncbi:cyclase [Mycobacterium sp. 1245111.1]|uniref:ATP-binding protein n=1 Tax=Mycobacterium sp. 1245111.1 TaxID=1834073 RepID=UPI0007FE7AB9|nr:AAA family ATPase [Mycobacterium sp. 1245111.1]OBK40713.1 cyclase [Mycobacterium sp. 1245111.1]
MTAFADQDGHKYAHWDAAYVLGALTETDRVEFDSHLHDCRICQVAVSELSGLPAFLALLEVGSPLQTDLVGRQWEMSAVAGLLDRALDGHGTVVGLVGAAGIGKSRLVREVSAMAAVQGVDVFTAFCESHTSQVPFHAVANLLRAAAGVENLDPPAARARIRAYAPDAMSEDVLLLEDLLGIADPDVELPKIDPDARRRRLTMLVNAASMARRAPAVFVIEDAHWIDEASESLLAEFLTGIARTPSLVLITYRPEYQGALTRGVGTQTISLAPLSDSETAGLVAELLGPDPTNGALGRRIAERAAGNPFFAEEIVRELAGRGVLRGEPGAYLAVAEIGEVTVPTTLQATIAARIDRLDVTTKRTLSAASVLGARFDLDLLAAMGVDTTVDELVAEKLIDRVGVARQSEYVFHHPSIRAVAYELQVESDRADLHRRAADAIAARNPLSGDENATLIAEHLEAAGDGHAAYAWQVRAATWATNRDITAAWRSWERARTIADALPSDDPDRAAMRIAPRTMLCGIAWRVHDHATAARFEELRELCAASGDKASLAIAMSGRVMDNLHQARLREASELASEAMALIESIEDPNLTVGLALASIYARAKSAEWPDALRWSQMVIDVADGDPSTGNFIIGSPLALAYTTRATASYCLGLPGWRDDLRHGLAMARSTDPMSYATVVTYAYSAAIPPGMLRPDDRAMGEIEDALRIAEQSGDDVAVAISRMTLGIALVHRQTDAERDRGQQVLADVRDVFLRRGFFLAELPIVEVCLAREQAQRGDRDGAIPLLRAVADGQFPEGRLLGWAIPATGVLVETLLERGTESDVVEAESAIMRLAQAPIERLAGETDGGFVVRDIWLMRLRALLARAHGDDASYARLRDGYRDRAKTLGFEGHIEWAEAMPQHLR